MAIHPLTRPAAWPLKVGAASVPAIKWAGGALWVLAALLGLGWLIGLIQDAFAGQLAAWVGALGTLAMFVWFGLAWQVARKWMVPSGTLTLIWQGPVRAADPTRSGHEAAQGGFHVAEWRSPARVHVVLDWQKWMLLSLRSCNPDKQGSHVSQAFCWVAVPIQAEQIDKAAGHSNALHQLRSLLYLPAAWLSQEPSQPSMASWSALVSSGSPLHPATKPLSARHRPSLAKREADTLFPPTEILDAMLAEVSEPVVPKGLA